MIAGIKLAAVDKQADLTDEETQNVIRKEKSSLARTIVDAQRFPAPIWSSERSPITILKCFCQTNEPRRNRRGRVVIAEVGAGAPADMGKVMKALRPNQRPGRRQTDRRCGEELLAKVMRAWRTGQSLIIGGVIVTAATFIPPRPSAPPDTLALAAGDVTPLTSLLPFRHLRFTINLRPPAPPQLLPCRMLRSAGQPRRPATGRPRSTNPRLHRCRAADASSARAQTKRPGRHHRY